MSIKDFIKAIKAEFGEVEYKAVSKLDGQKIVWMMLPAGEITKNQIADLIPLLNKGDIIIDGGNSNFIF